MPLFDMTTNLAKNKILFIKFLCWSFLVFLFQLSVIHVCTGNIMRDLLNLLVIFRMTCSLFLGLFVYGWFSSSMYMLRHIDLQCMWSPMSEVLWELGTDYIQYLKYNQAHTNSDQFKIKKHFDFPNTVHVQIMHGIINGEFIFYRLFSNN